MKSMCSTCACFIGTVFILAFPGKSFSQLPDCVSDCDRIYVHIDPLAIFYSWDPFQPLSASNPFLNTISVATPTSNGRGLAICENLNSSTAPSPTFYTTALISGIPYYHYYDGTAWVNTGHRSGSTAPNLGGGGGYLYSLNWGPGDVYQYDGTGDARVLLSIPGGWSSSPGVPGKGTADIVVDYQGNFYLHVGISHPQLRKYSPAGVLLDQWDISGLPSLFQGSGGMAIVKNTLILSVNYSASSSQIFMGTIGAGTINVAPSPVAFSTVYNPADFASCPIAGISSGPRQFTNDTVFLCTASPGATLTASGIAPYTYSVIEGEATVTVSGPDYRVVPATTTTRIVLYSSSPVPCDDEQRSDTFLIVSPPSVSVHTDDTITRCTPYTDMLEAIIINKVSWIRYSINWMPAGFIMAGEHTLAPIIAPLSDTTFIITVSTDSTQGNCSISDSVRVMLNEPVFHNELKHICSNESYFFNDSWLNSPGTYYDTLTAANGCDSTVTLNLIVLPAPEISVVVDEILPLCLGDSVFVTADGGMSYLWYSGKRLIDSAAQRYIHLPDRVNKAIVVGMADNDCRDSVDVVVHADACCDMFIPNAFTPNGDGLNDDFGPRANGHFNRYQMQIFNRWGQNVFVSADINTHWDGSYNGLPADVGVYYYIATVMCRDGTEFQRKGDVTLIR